MSANTIKIIDYDKKYDNQIKKQYVNNHLSVDLNPLSLIKASF